MDYLPFPDKKYQVIYADPPWEYNDKHDGNINPKYNVINPIYPVMKIKDICNIPVKGIADKDCILFIWVTFPHLQEGLKVIESWGFKYKTIGFNWIKTRKNGRPYFGIGHYTKSSGEICLIGMKGKLSNIKKSNKIHNLVFSELKRHSQKPDIIRDKIVQFAGDRPRIELFARQESEGWDVWGNEI